MTPPEGSEDKAGVDVTDNERRRALSETKFGKLLGGVAVVVLLVWGVQILGFVTYSVLTQAPPSKGWLNKIIQDHYPAIIGIPLMSMSAICIVMIFQVAIGTPIEFEALGFKFRGASGPLLMWVICFLVLTLAMRVLWSV
jgi:hypothetical protein